MTLTLGQDSPLGYHRVSYDPIRRWGYCAKPGARPEDCWIPLPDAPTDEVLDAAAEWIVYTHQRRDVGNATAACPVGTEDGMLPVRHVSDSTFTLSE